MASGYITPSISIQIREANKGNEWLLDDTMLLIESKGLIARSQFRLALRVLAELRPARTRERSEIANSDNT